jgi:hypothetical protein
MRVREGWGRGKKVGLRMKTRKVYFFCENLRVFIILFPFEFQREFPTLGTYNIKLDLQEVGWGVWTGLIWLRIGTGGGLL